MRRKNPVIVTTTDSPVEGRVTRHCGVVSAHVVAGTGLFSDIGASFSDVFGGRSKTYQKQLSAITEEVLGLLQERARELEANCVLGARIDHDEISGSGKSMFMVTASGTAVFVDLPRESATTSQEDDGISADDLQLFVERTRIEQWLKTDPDTISDTMWALIIKHAYSDAAKVVLGVLELKAARGDYIGEETENLIRTFLESLSAEEATRHLYTALLETSHEPVRRLVTILIVDLDLVDYGLLKSVVENGRFEAQYRVLEVSQKQKSYYASSDISRIRDLVAALEDGSNFDRSDRYEKKRTLSSKTDTFWKCVCGEENSDQQNRCKSCGRDDRGFQFDSGLSPEGVAARLRERLALLESVLGS